MDKQVESRRLRRELLQLYSMKLDWMKQRRDVECIQRKIKSLSTELIRLELGMHKNRQYLIVDLGIDDTPISWRADPRFEGYCKGCGRSVFEDDPKHPNDKEGLFHSKYCREKWRTRQAKEQAIS